MAVIASIFARLGGVKLLLVGGGIVAAFIAGFVVANWRAGAAITDEVKERLVSLELERQILVNELEAERQLNAEISKELAADAAAREADRRKFEEKLREVRNQGAVLRCNKPDGDVAGGAGNVEGDGIRPGARPGVVCDADCIGLWHDALAQGLPPAYGSWRAHADAGAPGAVADTELFANAAENFRIGNECRAQLLGWQRWAREQGLTP